MLLYVSRKDKRFLYFYHEKLLELLIRNIIFGELCMRDSLFQMTWDKFFDWLKEKCVSVSFKLFRDVSAFSRVRNISKHETLGFNIKIHSQYHSIFWETREVAYPDVYFITFYREATPTMPTTFSTYKQEFPLEDTKEVLTCPDCYGSGKVTCPKCGGSGKIRCPSCLGSGKCLDCGGSGKITCSYCFGSGRYMDETCSYCSGNGYLVCNSCGGSGECYYCNGTGRITCPKCGGSGEITCKRCKGSGKIVTYKVEVHKFFHKWFEANYISDNNLSSCYKKALSKGYKVEIKEISEDEITKSYGYMSEEIRGYVNSARETYRNLSKEAKDYDGRELFRDEFFSYVPIHYIIFFIDEEEKYYIIAGTPNKYVIKAPRFPISLKKISLQSFYMLSPLIVIIISL